MAENYEKAFDLLREEIPNLSDSLWAAGGFSNGAHSFGGILKSKRLKKLFKYFIICERSSEIGSLSNKTEGILFIGKTSLYGNAMTVSKKKWKSLRFPDSVLKSKKEKSQIHPYDRRRT